MRSENTRVYSIGDAHMLETAYTLHSLFNDNIADFTAFDATLDAAFATSWLATIDAAGTVVRDSQIKDIQAGKTVTVLEQMDLCRIKYNEVKYFAGKAFPRNKVKLAEFGAEDYDKVRRSQALMVSFMDEMHKACVTYTTELQAAGMTVGQIDEVNTLRTDLLNANTTQENYMRARPKLTDERITTLNTSFETTMTVVTAAQVVYYNDYASRRMFVFSPTGSSGGGETDSEIVNLTIIDDDTSVEVFTIAYDPSRQITVNNSGPAQIEIYIADAPDAGGTPMTVSDGETSTFTSDMLGPNGDSIFAKVLSGSGPEATIEVEISLEI